MQREDNVGSSRSLLYTMLLLTSLLVVGLALVGAAEPPEVFAVTYEWYKLDFTWPDDSSKARSLDSAHFIPENTTVSGIKAWKDRFYLTLPRWRRGVPVTLASVPRPGTAGTRGDTAPPLEPFPTWDMQHVGNCSAFQFVQNIEITPEGLMWVLDSGSIDILSDRPDTRCPPKLIVFNLNTPGQQNQGVHNTQYNGDIPQNAAQTSSFGNTAGNAFNFQSAYNARRNNVNAEIERIFVFPDSLVSKDSYLVDIVVDKTDGDYAYMSDASETDPGIIVYSWRENRAWKVRDKNSMRADPSVKSIRIRDSTVEIKYGNIAGLALSPMKASGRPRTLYFSPLASYMMYAISTSVLRDSMRDDVSGMVETLGRKDSPSFGMAMDSRGILYYGLLEQNAIARWDTNLPFQNNQHVIAQDNRMLQWPAGFGFDVEAGNLTLISNRLQNYLMGRVNLQEPNYRVISAYTGAKSYFFSESTYEPDMYSSTMNPEAQNGRQPEQEMDHPQNSAGRHVVTSLTLLCSYLWMLL